MNLSSGRRSIEKLLLRALAPDRGGRAPGHQAGTETRSPMVVSVGAEPGNQAGRRPAPQWRRLSGRGPPCPRGGGASAPRRPARIPVMGWRRRA